MEITSHTKLFDLLGEYPALEEEIIKIAPPFASLKNPVLRRTVGKLATLEKVAQIGNLDVGDFVNSLRRAVGQAEIKAEAGREVILPEKSADDPDWITGEPQFIVDGVELLQRGEVPLNRVIELLKDLSPERYLLLLTNFEPSPMLEAMEKQNHRVFRKLHPQQAGHYLTFIQ